MKKFQRKKIFLVEFKTSIDPTEQQNEEKRTNHFWLYWCFQFGQNIKYFGCHLYVCHLFWLFCLFIHSCLSYDCAYSSNFFVSSSFPVDYPIFSNSWNSLKTTWIDHFQLCFQVLFAFLMSCSLCHCFLWIHDECFVS